MVAGDNETINCYVTFPYSRKVLPIYLLKYLRVWHAMFELVTKVRSPRNLSWFTKVFILVGRWGLGIADSLQ